MIFASPPKSSWPSPQKKLGIHARVKVRLPIEKKVISEIRVDKDKITRRGDRRASPTAWCCTTVGRVHLQRHPASRRWRSTTCRCPSKHLSRIIADCYQLLGRRETIELLDRMKEIGFRESTRSRPVASPPTTCARPHNKEKIINDTEKEVDKVQKQFQRGIITETERYNKVIDLWTHARDEITKQMMEDLQERRPRRHAVPESDLPDGPLRRPRRRRADSPAGRHARPDGQAVRHRSSRRRSRPTSAKA